MLFGSFDDVRQSVQALLPPNLLIDQSVCELGLVPDLNDLMLHPLVSVGDGDRVPQLSESEFWDMVRLHGWYNYGLGLLCRFLSTPYTAWPSHLVVPGATMVFGGVPLRCSRREGQRFVVTLELSCNPLQEALRTSVGGTWTGSPCRSGKIFVVRKRGVEA